MNEKIGYVYSLWSGRFICKQGKVINLTEHWEKFSIYLFQ